MSCKTDRSFVNMNHETALNVLRQDVIDKDLRSKCRTEKSHRPLSQYFYREYLPERIRVLGEHYTHCDMKRGIEDMLDAYVEYYLKFDYDKPDYTYKDFVRDHRHMAGVAGFRKKERKCRPDVIQVFILTKYASTIDAIPAKYGDYIVKIVYLD